MSRGREYLSMRRLVAMTAVLAFTAGAANPLAAQDMEKHFSGKTIDLIVGAAAGGGADLDFRLLAKHAGKHFPGKPRFIVKNITGAAQLTGLQTSVRAKPDGLTAGTLSTRWAVRSMLGDDLGPFNIKTVRIVGSPLSVPRGDLICADKKVADSWQAVMAMKTPLKLAGEPGGRSSLGPFLLEHIGAPIKNIGGYGGTSEETAAFDRGELTAVTCNEATVPRLFPEWLEKKRLVPLFWWDAPPSAAYLERMGAPGKVPHVLELQGVTFPADAKPVLDAALKLFLLTRAVILPPKTPDDIYEAWRQAYAATITDPAFVEDAAKGGLDTGLGKPEDFASAIAGYQALSPSGKALFKKLMQE